jgi:hypothetical protein
MVRIERLIIVLLGIALLRAWWKLYKGKVKRWLKRVKDHLPRLFWLHHTSVRNQAKKSWRFDHSNTVKLARMHIML